LIAVLWYLILNLVSESSSNALTVFLWASGLVFLAWVLKKSVIVIMMLYYEYSFVTIFKVFANTYDEELYEEDDYEEEINL
jgi:hypothetical protein